ncbi:MAG: RT0821/Lpp0805 family surface protein, partial [Rhodospirillales bacterium]
MLATVVAAGMMAALSGCAYPTGYPVAHVAERQAPGPNAALTEADKRYLEQTVQKILEVNKVGQGSNWLNPETGHGGTVVPTLTYKDKAGQDCREYQWSVTVDGKVRFAHGTRCRQGKGVWAVVEAPAADPALGSTYSYRSDPYPYPYFSYPYFSYPY